MKEKKDKHNKKDKYKRKGDIPDIKDLDYSKKDSQALGQDFRALSIEPENYGQAIQLITKQSKNDALVLTKGILSTVGDQQQYIDEATTLIDFAKDANNTERQVVIQAVIEEGGKPASLFLMQNIAGMTRSQARPMMKDYFESGGENEPVAQWLQLAGKVLREHNVKDSSTAGAVVDAVGDAVDWVIDALEDGVDAILEGIESIIDAIVEAGIAIATVFNDVMTWTINEMADLITALFEAGQALGDFIAGVFVWTYNAVADFVAAAFEVGVTIAELLVEVVEETYWSFRRIVNGIIENLGPIGDVLDWVLSQVGDVVDELWRRTLLAIRFAGGALTDALNWMLDQGANVVEAIIQAWESIQEDLIDLYEWASGVAVDIWEHIGEATQRLGNSISYVLNFLKEDLIPGIFNFVRGVVRAGFAVASLIAWMVEESLEVITEVVRGLIDIGTTIGTLIIETLQNPGDALDNLLRALRDIGQTLEDVYQAAIVETAEDFLEEVTLTLLEIGEAVFDMLNAVAEVALGAIGAVIGILLNTLGTYRPLTQNEIDDARTVFGDSLDYNSIFISAESLTNDIIFGIQDFFTGNPDSRAFVTNSLINIDVNDAIDIDGAGTLGVPRDTLIHELTHTWQHEETGPFYLAEAIHAQISAIGGTGYNYGYQEIDPNDNAPNADRISYPQDYIGTLQDVTTVNQLGATFGINGEAALQAANGDFEAFNREQQGQILMQWFMRTQLSLSDINGNPVVLDATDWQPYRDFVFS